MIDDVTFPIEPWGVRETGFDLELLAQSESLFALSNGHLGLRGNLDEGEPHALPGTYLNSVHEKRPLPYAEAGYGYPEDGQTIVVTLCPLVLNQHISALSVPASVANCWAPQAMAVAEVAFQRDRRS